MLLWLLLASLLAFLVLAATGGLSVRRYSGSHVVAQLAVGGRGLYFSRTPDGVWWRLRLRPARRVCENRRGWGEPRLTAACVSRAGRKAPDRWRAW